MRKKGHLIGLLQTFGVAGARRQMDARHKYKDGSPRLFCGLYHRCVVSSYDDADKNP